MPLISVTLLFSLCLGAFGAWFMAQYAFRFGLLDIPNDRSSHNLPTPRGGGVGILLAYIATSLYISLPTLIWLPAVLLAFVSFFDDKINLIPRTRLIFQVLVALVSLSSLFNAQNVYDLPSLALLQLFTLYLFFCIVAVGTANFYNFMDGINGIAGITGVVAFGLIGYFANTVVSQTVISTSSYGVAAACLGFLPFNMPRARVFMGDVGSILLGFVFAVYIILLSHSVTDFLVLAGFLSTFYIDSLTTLYVRKRSGEQLSQAHRRHLYQLLSNQLKIPHWKVSVSYGVIQLVIGLLLLAVHPYGLGIVISVIVSLIIVWIAVMHKIRSLVES